LPALIALLALSFRHVAAQEQPTEDTTVVRGTVVNAVTHEAIGRVLVYSTDNRFAVLTDGEGHFEFTVPKTPSASSNTGTISGPRPFDDGGALWLMARKPGFPYDPNRRGEIQAFPGRQLTIPLWPEALIKGRVTISGSEPAAGIDVEIFFKQVAEGTAHWQSRGSARTDSNGEFRFAELAEGPYKLVTHESLDNDPATTVPGGQIYGLPPVYFPGVADFDAAGIIQLRPGQTFEADMVLRTQPYFPVRIPVSGADAASGLGVNVSLQGHRSPGYSLGFNSEKGRIEGLLPNGAYVVEARTGGQNSASGVANLVVSGSAAEGSPLVLNRNGSITVNVTEQFNSTDWQGSSSWSDGRHTFRLKGPRLYLQMIAEPADDFQSRGGGALRPPTGSNDDSLVIEGLSPGRYWLRLISSRGYVASATIGEVDLLHEPFEFISGSSTPIEITMRDDGAELSGTLTGLGSSFPTPRNSAAPISVYCVPLPEGSSYFQQIWANSDGAFSATNVAPGAYRLLAFPTQQTNLPYRDPEAMRAYESKGQVVHLTAGQKTTVQLQLITNNE